MREFREAERRKRGACEPCNLILRSLLGYEIEIFFVAVKNLFVEKIGLDQRKGLLFLPRHAECDRDLGTRCVSDDTPVEFSRSNFGYIDARDRVVIPAQENTAEFRDPRAGVAGYL